MTFKVFALRDTKSKTYAPPFYMQSTGAAVRAFADLVNDPQSFPSKHPSDFILFEIGKWEDDTGHFENYKEPTHLGVGSEYKIGKPTDLVGLAEAHKEMIGEEKFNAIDGVEVNHGS